ncbi:hypothetical protein [Mycobacteroides salmoniphilum]|uniref:hypothetical protein n=1 Tax=Mycobacteroides salmoniphilum TaxID=404941 RepID=UPI0010AA3E64|nr:hypothetical protein [Mycobacteroides salmoniphilum]QCH23337.1 hypothetical protein DSM43276_01595 [Mycobacteroides salmoniphilum]
MSIPVTLLAPPPDDSGAETADRYDWQALTAAADYLLAVAKEMNGSLQGSNNVKIICEHHEDFILCLNEEIQLVSVKHRDLSRGSWTFATLFTEGGIAHLFSRWSALGGKSYARLVTNAGLASGPPAQLHKLCQYLREFPFGPHRTEHWALILTTAKRIINTLTDENITKWVNDDKSPTSAFLWHIQQFLSALLFDCGRPTRDILPSAAASMYAVPFLTAIDHPVELAHSFWEAVSNIFRRRMRGRNTPPDDAFLAAMRNIQHLSEEQLLELKISERTITCADIIDVLKVVQQIEISPLDRHLPLAPTRLALKLYNSGCRNTTIHAAEAAARLWREYESDVALSTVGLSANLEKVKTRALIVASGIQESTALEAKGTDYGPQMWAALRTSLSTIEIADPLLTLDEDLALGLICDLASQCRIWFSDAFDLGAARDMFPDRAVSAIESEVSND